MSLDFGKSIKGSVIYILVIVSISLLTIPDSITNNIKVNVASPLAPVQKIISKTSNFFKNGFKKLSTMSESADKKDELEKEVFLLKNTIIKQKNVINVFRQKLEVVSEFKKNDISNEKPLIADIIGYDASNFRKSIIIDVGKKHGVSIDDVVVYGNALVGRISAIGRSSSRVLLISDPASNVPSRFIESRTQGIVQGSTNGTCIMKYVTRQTEIFKNDEVISSGIGGIFPKNLYIGSVIEAKQKNANLFKSIKIQPRVDISRIEHVLVINKLKVENIP